VVSSAGRSHPPPSAPAAGGLRERAADPGHLLREVVSSAHDLTVTLARAAEMAPSDLRALDLLMAGGAMGPHELGARLGLSPAATTALADRLERAGHVVRRREQLDRRRVVLEPTPHARRRAHEILGGFLEEVRGAVDELSDDERAVISRFLERVLEIQRRHAHPSGAGRKLVG